MSQTTPDATLAVKGKRLVISGPHFASFSVTPERAAELHQSLQEKPLPLGHFLWTIREGCFRSYDARAIRIVLIRHFKAVASKKRFSAIAA